MTLVSVKCVSLDGKWEVCEAENIIPTPMWNCTADQILNEERAVKKYIISTLNWDCSKSQVLETLSQVREAERAAAARAASLECTVS